MGHTYKNKTKQQQPTFQSISLDIYKNLLKTDFGLK